jgi:hypothetical protein
VRTTLGDRGEELIVRVMIRYKVKPDQLERNLELLRAVYEELESTQLDGLSYATFQLDDRTRFVVLVETEDLGPVSRLGSFRRYRATLDERCDEAPVTTALHEVGSYDRH